MKNLKADIWFNKPEILKSKIENAPLNPGCYIYFNKNEKVIYVGKAKKIRNRVKSYFSNFNNLDNKTANLVKNIFDVKFLEVDTEIEALILESRLIKKFNPKYNILLKDDKHYVYVKIEKFRKKNSEIPTKFSPYQDFPKVSIVRKKEDNICHYFGPYPDTKAIKSVVYTLRKIYPFRTNNNLVYFDYKKNEVVSNSKKPDLFFHIGISHGAEFGLSSLSSYQNNIKSIIKFFSAEKLQIVEELKQKIKLHSNNLEFEKATFFRDKLSNFNYAISKIHIDNEFDNIDIENFRTKEKSLALEELLNYLNFKKNNATFKIECYDISNFQGTNAVGAMSVNLNGKLEPKLYRKFKINLKNTPNDFAMMKEILMRRFSEKNISSKDISFGLKPDLIIVDGGKGQLSVAFDVLKEIFPNINLVGLAKREEEIFKVKNTDIDGKKVFERILLPRKSQALFLVQQIRDEAHRFGITYHRLLRSKKLISN